MEVIAWSKNLTEERCRDVGVRKVDKETLFRESDVLSIHVILGERTRGLVSVNDLASMKSSSYLINTSRAMC